MLIKRAVRITLVYRTIVVCAMVYIIILAYHTVASTCTLHVHCVVLAAGSKYIYLKLNHTAEANIMSNFDDTLVRTYGHTEFVQN